ncbi:MAG: InlB B-repeat-containing protein, partial [Prevotellaceae bacterium]|nr:InlB B-repeat-containing protein [Prevotellaceae bacterium]
SFYSWNTEREGNGATYTSSTVYEADGDVKLYAQWRAKRYALRFNANGGTPVDPDSLGVTYDVAVGSLPTPLREGEYEFVEWNAAQDGSGVKYESSTLYSIDGNLTLYAQWKSTDEGNNNNNDDDDGGNNNNNNDDDDDEEEEDGNDDGGNNNDPTGVATAGSRQILKLYPNPITGGKLMIDSEQLKNLQGLKDKKLKVKIYTLSGSLVGEYAAVYGAKVTTINVGHLASGVYMVKVGDMVGRVVKK